ncbi:hypothetical protein PFISCL1PPCAC_13216, partial [Pristionchus fissidentatus]
QIAHHYGRRPHADLSALALRHFCSRDDVDNLLLEVGCHLAHACVCLGNFEIRQMADGSALSHTVTLREVPYIPVAGEKLLADVLACGSGARENELRRRQVEFGNDGMLSEEDEEGRSDEQHAGPALLDGCEEKHGLELVQYDGRAAIQQGRAQHGEAEDLVEGHVEQKGFLGPAVILGRNCSHNFAFEVILDDVDHGAEVAMGQHDSLGRARGTGRVGNVSQRLHVNCKYS